MIYVLKESAPWVNGDLLESTAAVRFTAIVNASVTLAVARTENLIVVPHAVEARPLTMEPPAKRITAKSLVAAVTETPLASSGKIVHTKVSLTKIRVPELSDGTHASVDLADGTPKTFTVSGLLEIEADVVASATETD